MQLMKTNWQTQVIIVLIRQSGYVAAGNTIKLVGVGESSVSDQLNNIINNIPHFVFWKDVNSVFLGCNQKFTDLIGFVSPQDIIGKTDYDMPWKKEQSDAYREDDKQVMESRVGKLNYEERQRQKDGSEIIVLVSKVPMFDKNGKVTGILGIYTDITDRKSAEEELKEAKERAEVANKAKSEFLAVVSHELRIPLTGILGMAQLLSGDNLQPEQHEQITDILKAGDHLLSVVTDILDFAKLEAGKFELQVAPLDLRKLIEDVATMLAHSVKAKGLELMISYAEDAPYRVLGDARALRQILLNLVGNALKFTTQGHIWIKVECAKQTITEATLILQVEDTGIGIPENKQQMIFDRFSQVDASRSRRYSGTGIGLTITKSYIELMCGSIKVQSQPSKGATFSCTLPFLLQDSPRFVSPWEAYKSEVRILIVDDTLHGEVMARHIASALCEVSGSENALNVIRAAQQRKEPFDVIVINQQLEKSDPVTLAKTIQQQPKLLQPVLVLVTSNKTLPQQHAAQANGFFACFARPTHPTELLTSLTATWEKWQESREQAQKPQSKKR